MERVITSFITLLRQQGVRVSPGESLDAICALALGGVEGRDQVRDILRLTLVKRVGDIPAFEEVFDRFFSGKEILKDNSDPADFIGAMIHIVEGFKLKAEEHQTREKDDPLLVTEGDAEDLEELLATEEGDDDSAGAEIMVQLDGHRGQMDAPMPADYYHKAPQTVAFNQNLGGKKQLAFTPEELADMQEVVGRMLVRIRKDVKRMKEQENRGKLHVVRTLQKNYRNGMVPFLVSLRRKRREKPRLVVFCDVSFSVSHATRFMLLLLHTLQSRVMAVRSFVFNREIAEITDLLRNMPVNCLLEAMDKGDIVNLDDNSDYGHVFETFKTKHLESMQGKPAIIIMGDGRNNYNEGKEWALEEIREKAGYMLWLTPEDQDIWQRGDCLMDLYGAYCDRVETVKDVDQLSRVVEELFCTLYDHHDTRSWKGKRPKTVPEEEYDYRSYYTRGSAGAKPAFDPTVRRQW